MNDETLNSRTIELPFHDLWCQPPPGAPPGQLPQLDMLQPNLMDHAQAAWRAVAKP